MAVFNPQEPPTNDPNYLGYSKGIDGGYGVDKSLGITLDTAATGIKEGASIADTAVNNYLGNKVRGIVEKERGDYTQYLESLKQIAQTNKIPGAGEGESIMDANASMDIPDGLQAGLDRASNYGAASTSGNKINDTLYTARLAAEASGLRATWSGYKDKIDEDFSKYSGMNPANAYYKNLMQDINTLAANANKDKYGANSIINEAVKAGDVPDADLIWSLHKAGKMSDDEAIHKISVARQAKATVTALETARVAKRGDRETTAADATRDFSAEVSGDLQRKMGLLQVGTGGDTLQGQVEWLTKISQNPDKVDPKEVQKSVTALGAMYDKLTNDYMARAAERDKTGQSYITRMGGVSKVQEEIKGNLSGLKQYIDSVNEGKFGIGTYVQRAIQAQSQADQRDLLSDPDLRKAKAIQDAFPTYGDVFVKTGLMGNVPEKLTNYMTGKRIDAATQPGLPNGEVSTIKKDFDEIDNKISNIKNADGTPRYSPTDVAKLKNEVFNIPKTIADPTLVGTEGLALKANIARHAFDPSNIGILQGIKMDYPDPYNNNRIVPGKYSAFQRMTSPDITENMDKVRKGVSDGPQLWNNYKVWTQTEFQKLFREDITNLSNLDFKGLHIGWTSGENGQPPRMKLLNERGEEPTTIQGARTMGMPPQLVSTVARINSAMYNLHQVYRKDGEDTNMPILQDLFNNWSPSEKTTGLPGKVMDAIILANRSKLQKMEDTFQPGK